MGGFRFKSDLNSNFINSDEKFKIPPLTSLNDLIFASSEIEKNEDKHLLPEKKMALAIGSFRLISRRCQT